jgi:hypothetical protein
MMKLRLALALAHGLGLEPVEAKELCMYTRMAGG